MILLLLEKINTRSGVLLDNFEYTFFDQQFSEEFSMLYLRKKVLRRKLDKKYHQMMATPTKVAVEEILNDDEADVFEDYYAVLLFGK